MKKVIFFLLFIFSSAYSYSQVQVSKEQIDSLIQFEYNTRKFRYAFEDTVEAHNHLITIAIDSIKCVAPQKCSDGESMLFRYVKEYTSIKKKHYRELQEYLRVVYFRSKIFSLVDGIIAPNEVQYEFTQEGVRVYFSNDVMIFRKDDVYLSKVYQFFFKLK